MCTNEGPNLIVNEGYAVAHMSAASVRQIVRRVLAMGQRSI